MNEQIKYRLINQYNQIDFLLEDLSDHFIAKRHHPKKWSIHENLAHLGRYQEIFIERIVRILNDEQPQFGRYRAEEDKFFENWINENTAEIIKKTKENRKLIIELISNISKQNLSRIGGHPKLGEMNIIDWAEFFLLHESHHLYTIFCLMRINKTTIQ